MDCRQMLDEAMTTLRKNVEDVAAIRQRLAMVDAEQDRRLTEADMSQLRQMCAKVLLRTDDVFDLASS